MKFLLPIICCSLLLAACAPTQSPVIAIQEPLEEIHAAEPLHQEAGSLWQDGDRSMFSDRKARDVGDIVTVIIFESASASKQASTKTDRASKIHAAIPNFFGLENSEIFTGDDPIDLSNLINAEFGDGFDGSGSTTRKEDLKAYLTTQVVGRYPNGQLKIRGGKEVMVNNEVQIIYLTGIIRPVDITAANTVSSAKILNARISYTGKGAISDKQKPGWAMRILDNVWPF